MTVRKITENDVNRCNEIVEGLSDWFDENEIDEIKKKFRVTPTYVYEKDGLILGFVCVKEKYKSALELESFGVDVTRHGCGAGTKLLKYVENELADGKVIVIKTLDDSSDCAPYIKTREFYEKNGFVKIEVISPYSGWTDDSPCAIYVKMSNRIEL